MSRLNQRTAGILRFEFLAAVLLPASIMAAAVPIYLATVEDPHERACRANMQTIASAEETWRAARPKLGYTTDLIDLNDHMGALPNCPKGGTYRLKKDRTGSGLTIACSVAKHGRVLVGRK